MNDFYTYAFLREDRTPYYIGKGTGKRIYSTNRKGLKPPKDKSRIIYLKQNLTEREAFKHEIYMIAVFGRKDLGTGILYNMTNGGEGTSGWVPSEETKMNIGEAKKGNTNCLGRILSKETKIKMSDANKGHIVSEETRKKISEASKGHIVSEETRRKLSESNKNPSEETRRKLSEASKGHIVSEETKRKISEANKNPSEETRRKMSKVNKGTKWWNDGCGNCKRMIEYSGNDWKPGRK